MADKNTRAHEKMIRVLAEALAMYADPGFYHAVAILADPPTGGFDKDVSFVKGSGYNRKMPGKLARAALQKADKIAASTFTTATTKTSEGER